MKVLIVTQHFLNGNGGGVFASRAYINAIASIVDKVTLLYPDKVGHPIEKIGFQVNAIPVKYDKPIIFKFADLILGKINRYAEAFQKILNTEKFDVVFFDNSKASFHLIDIAHNNGCKVVTIHHNYEYEYNRDNYRGIVKHLNLFWTRKYEKDAITKSDLNLTLTNQDKSLLTQKYGGDKPIEVLGCFEYEVNPEYKYSAKHTRLSKKFVITGSLSSIQTENSLLKWLDQYYPLLTKQYPDAQLVIAGKSPSSRIANKCVELGVQIIPSPKDIDSIVKEADYYICPTFLGGGLKLRVMDGLRAGLPVLSHDVSARGYDVFRGKCLFPYTDKESFISSLIKICTCGFSSKEIIDIYKNSFSFEAGVKRLQCILEKNGILICNR